MRNGLCIHRRSIVAVKIEARKAAAKGNPVEWNQWFSIIFLGGFGLFFLLSGIAVILDPSGRFGGAALLSLALVTFFVIYSLLALTEPQQDTTQNKKPDQASKPTPKPEESKPEEPKPDRITVESTTCLIREAKTSEQKISTAETSELRVTLSVPSNARECHDTVTVDSPTFGLGKEATQAVTIVRPKESRVARWLLDPEKPGSWSIAVETKKDRDLVPVVVTTPLGFSATWVQAGAFLAGAATIIFGVLAFLRRGL